MIEAMAKEIHWAGKIQSFPLKTLYFGGGTPSLLEESELQVLVNAVQESFGHGYEEFTLESNPDDITPEKVQMWKKIGVNRLSIGLQSFKEQDLQWMNRAHDVEQSNNCVRIAQEGGIDNITVDMMYGLPALTDQEWTSHIQKVLALGVDHVSAYCLTVEERTALAQKVAKEEIIPLDEEQQSRQFEILLYELAKGGLDQYEISNFSRPGKESKHNSAYWNGSHYVGIGPSAHSFSGDQRRWNIANNSQYIKIVNEQGQWFETESLSAQDQFNELLLTGLRTVRGVYLKQLEKFGELDAHFWTAIKDFKDSDLLIHDKDIIKLTPKGRLQADYIASELFKVND